MKPTKSITVIIVPIAWNNKRRKRSLVMVQLVEPLNTSKTSTNSSFRLKSHHLEKYLYHNLKNNNKNQSKRSYNSNKKTLRRRKNKKMSRMSELAMISIEPAVKYT